MSRFIVFGILLLTLFSNGLSAQDSTGYKAWYVGIQGGAGYYTTIFNPAIRGAAGSVGSVFGVSTRFESPRYRAIELGARYRQGGWKEFDAYERKMQILEFPITGNVAFGKGKTKGFVTLGETITYVLSESEEHTDTAYSPIIFNKPVSSKWGFAINLGGGMLWPVGKSLVQFEIRGTFQVTNLFDPSDEEIDGIGLSNSLPLFIEGNVKYLIRVK